MADGGYSSASAHRSETGRFGLYLFNVMRCELRVVRYASLVAIYLLQLPGQIPGKERQAEKVHVVRTAEVIDFVLSGPFLVHHVQLLDLVGFIAPLQVSRENSFALEFDQNLHRLVNFFMPHIFNNF